VRTAFNLLGPLTNPARPRAQVVGVPRPELTAFLASCLARLGVGRAWVVHGDGLDELSLHGATQVAEVRDGAVTRFEVTAEEAGLAPAAREALRGGDAAQNATLAQEVLAGAPGPRRDVVLLNAAAALLVAGRASTLREGVALAAAALDDGRAASVLHRAREIA
jgi:anthranilate phosphoribosyltransferase